MQDLAKPAFRSCDTVVVGGHFALHPSAATGNITQISETELATFRRAVTAVTDMADRGACLKLLVGDLELPQESRRDLAWAVPEAYRAALRAARLGGVAIMAESRCRNTGARKVVTGLRKQVQAKGAERLYAETGVGLVSLGDSDARCLYLVADVLLDQPGPHDAVIALTRPGSGIPTCPVLAAGALADMAASGARHYHAFYDSEDDPAVEKKLVEGVYAAGLGLPALNLTCDIVVSSNHLPQSRTVIETAGLRRPGRRDSLTGLVQEAHRAMRRRDRTWMFSEPTVLTG